MGKVKNRDFISDEEMMKEVDFSKAVKSQHHKSFRHGFTVHIEKKDGTVEVRHYTKSDGFVLLDPDLRKHFRSSRSVNKALRELIEKR